MKKLKKTINESQSLLDVIRKMGWSVSGSSYKKLNKLIEENQISTDHFLSPIEIALQSNKEMVKQMSEILVENSTYSRSSLKKRLVKEDFLEYKCSTDGCENIGEWMGKKISLILDHINGVSNDNRIENLRFLCPNCNASLDTHCGKNKIKSNNNCSDCGRSIRGESKKCVACSNNDNGKKLRKVKRPEYAKLLSLIKDQGYSATGRQYGVSDNTIRKWVKYYEK